MLLVLATALMLALTLTPPPAHAHDTLIAADPEDGATLETSPEEITLTFSANILDVSPVARISDEDGELLTEITPRVEGPDAIVELTEPLPAGTHTIQWRVVSSDGHPIEGALTITVEQDSEDSASEDGADEGDQQASDGGGEQSEEPAPSSEEGQADEGSETVAEDEADESGSGTLPLLLSVIGVAVVGAAVAAFFVLRRKQ